MLIYIYSKFNFLLKFLSRTVIVLHYKLILMMNAFIFLLCTIMKLIQVLKMNEIS
jgi:hypothetical protein